MTLPNIDWKWLLIGMALGMFVVPRVIGAVTARGK